MRRALVLVLVLLWLGALAAPAAADRGPWGWPLPGAREVARPFAPPASVYGAGHRGADLPSATGAPVRAAASGRVTYAGLVAGRGVVVVTHGALRTTYEPVTAHVDVGQAVSLGEVVGRLEAGHLGCPVQACLHWGLRRGEEYLDPVRLVARGPVRLLPLDGRSVHAGALVDGTTQAATTAGAAGGVRGPAFPGVAGGSADGAGTVRRGASAGGLAADGLAGGVAGGVAAGGRAAAAAPSALRQPRGSAQGPAWSVRASEAPLGLAAVAALVLGIGLLARPAPTRPGPAAPPAAGSARLGSAAASVVATSTTPPTPVLPYAAPPAATPPAPAVAPPAAAVALAATSTVPRETPPVPTSPAGAVSPSDASPEPAPPVADVLELSVERARRRPA